MPARVLVAGAGGGGEKRGSVHGWTLLCPGEACAWTWIRSTSAAKLCMGGWQGRALAWAILPVWSRDAVSPRI